jgi:hypothetical protein
MWVMIPLETDEVMRLIVSRDRHPFLELTSTVTFTLVP